MDRFEGLPATIRACVDLRANCIGKASQLKCRTFPNWSAAQSFPAEAQDSLFTSLERPLADVGTVVQFCLPTQMLRYPGKLNVNFTVFEATQRRLRGFGRIAIMIW